MLPGILYRPNPGVKPTETQLKQRQLPRYRDEVCTLIYHPKCCAAVGTGLTAGAYLEHMMVCRVAPSEWPTPYTGRRPTRPCMHFGQKNGPRRKVGRSRSVGTGSSGPLGGEGAGQDKSWAHVAG